MKISQLPDADDTLNVVFPVAKSGTTAKVSFAKILSDLKKELGIVDNPMRKCGHCGQWGAIYCACRYCGAPVA